MPQRNIHLALFDVRPPRPTSGRVEAGPKKDAGELRVARVVNLRGEPPLPPLTVRGERGDSYTQRLLGDAPRATEKDIVAHEVEAAIGEGPIVADLVSVGATIHTPQKQTPARPRIIVPPKPQPAQEPVVAPHEPGAPKTELIRVSHPELENFWAKRRAIPPPAAPVRPVLAVRTAPPVARDVELWLKQMRKPRREVGWKFFTVLGLCGIIGGIGFFAVSFGRGRAQERVIKEGASALANLESAKINLEQLQFSDAADDFSRAYENFNEASSTLDNVGASILSLIPGLGSVRSATNLVAAGKSISQAGSELSQALSQLSAMNVFAVGEPLAAPIQEFRDVLDDASANIGRAARLLAEVDASAVPEEKRELFENFRSKIPEVEGYLGQMSRHASSLAAFVGPRGPRTYLMLLENNSERRPTGGFPGTYAIISFEDGALKKVFVDDIYNPDGQIKANIIPPKPLQHITPNLGMRDACWFADFPTCARKIQEYYALDGGGKLDGVFAVTPTVITRLLKIVGPVELPEYGVTLDAGNFLAEIQDEVEHKGDRASPKKIVADFQPKFFAKLAEANKDQRLAIINVLLDAAREKHLLVYFNAMSLQKEVSAQGVSGELRSTGRDYLQVAFSNVRGAKADAVTANAMRLVTTLGGDQIGHMLTITRSHQGGDSAYPFYNKELPAYVKVYLPRGAVFERIEGNTNPNYQPLINYQELGFKPDPDLAAVEATMSHPAEDVDVFEESGKTVVGFWIITKPRKTSSVTVTYHVSRNILNLDANTYSLLWQKQSGTDGDHMQVSISPQPPLTVRGGTEGIQILGNTAVLDTDLSVDREVNLRF